MPNIFGLPTQQEIQQERFKNAVQLFSQAAPGVAPAVVAGQGLAGTAAGLLGIPDVQLDRAKRMQAIQSELAQDGIAPGSEGFIDEARRRARARGLFDVDAILAQRGAEMEKEALQTEKLRGEVARQRQIIDAENRAIAEEGELTGLDRILSRAAKLPGSTADLNNARALAGAAMERQGIEPTFANVTRAGRAVMTAMEGAVKTTATQEGIAGSTTVSDPGFGAKVADAVVARAVGAGALRQTRPIVQGGQSISPSQPPVSGLATNPAPTKQIGRAMQQEGRGRVKAQGTKQPIDEFNIDTAAKAGARTGGTIKLEDVRSANAYIRAGSSPERIKRLQIEADGQIGAIGKVVRLNNAIAQIIEEEGAAFPSALGRWAMKMREVTQGSSSWTADLVRTVSATMRQFANDIKDPREQLIVKKLTQAVQRNALTQKEIESLGALSGPDFQILRAITDNPTEYLFRRTGIRGYFDLASESVNQMYINAQQAISGTGLQGINAKSLPAPHQFLRLGRHRAEVEDISQQMEQGMTPAEGARAMSQRLGFKVTPKGAQMISSTGMFTPVGSDTEIAQQEAEAAGLDILRDPGRGQPGLSGGPMELGAQLGERTREAIGRGIDQITDKLIPPQDNRPRGRQVVPRPQRRSTFDKLLDRFGP